MAAIAVTAANVLRVDGQVVQYNSGATLTAGMAVYVDSNGLVQIATNATSVGSGVGAPAVGIVLNTASSGQPCDVLITGTVNIGGTAAIGKEYKIGTGGGIIPVDDTAGGEYSTAIGIGTTAANIKLGINVSGVTAAGAVV